MINQNTVVPCEAIIGRAMRSGCGQTDRQRGARDEEEGDAARVVDAGLHQPPAQHLHIFVVGLGIMFGGVVDQPGHRPQAGIAQRPFEIGFSLAIIHEARSAPFYRAAHAREAPSPKGQWYRRREIPAAPSSDWSCRRKNRDRELASTSSVDPEIDHAEHDDIADAHPAAGQHQTDFGQILVPDDARRNSAPGY